LIRWEGPLLLHTKIPGADLSRHRESFLIGSGRA
jgi:hypothetical protein